MSIFPTDFGEADCAWGDRLCAKSHEVGKLPSSAEEGKAEAAKREPDRAKHK
jgi:hypothetical protein